MKPFTVLRVPAETRTLDPLIKSQLLYQLSYGDSGVQKYRFCFNLCMQFKAACGSSFPIVRNWLISTSVC